MMRFVTVAHAERAAWIDAIVALEADATYPLGTDRFRLDHGPDYFAFFDRLGEARHDIAIEDGRVLAIACGVVRSIPLGGQRVSAWYGCDMKVIPEARGRHIPLRMLANAFVSGYARCRRGYAISMDPPDRENPVARLLGRFPLLPIRKVAGLVLYSLDAHAMRGAAPLLVRARGPIGYRSLAGIKDVVLESTGRPMPLWHVQHGVLGDPTHADPVEGGVHMFSVPDDDALVTDLRSLGLEPSATASVLAHGLDDARFDFVLTSDI
jgi:hypothetical protein